MDRGAIAEMKLNDFNWLLDRKYEECPSGHEITMLLATHGIVTSVCVGPTKGGDVPRWSVLCYVPDDGLEFDKPFAAKDFPHAMQIAFLECKQRGWLDDGRIRKKPDHTVVG